MAANRYADTLKVLGRALGTPEGRKYFQLNGYVPGTPIIPALEHDLVGEVMERGHERGSAFLVAVIISGELQVLHVSDSSVPPERMTHKRGVVHVNSDIGMLFHAVQRDEQVRRYQIVDDAPAAAVGLFSRGDLAHA